MWEKKVPTASARAEALCYPSEKVHDVEASGVPQSCLIAGRLFQSSEGGHTEDSS